MAHPYFKAFEWRRPPPFPPLSRAGRDRWHFLAGAAIAAAIWYLHWRWTLSINPDAPLFSRLVAAAETLFFIGTLLFYFDIWDEGDTPQRPAPRTRAGAGLAGETGAILVDVFITSFDEDLDIVAPSIDAALCLRRPENTRVQVHLLDDGDRPDCAGLARRKGVNYITRSDNTGFKAGNLRNALFATSGDFVLICDADTRVFPGFLEQTLGYFCDPRVAWVQTPHWFYDIPRGTDWASWLQARLGRAPGWLVWCLRRASGLNRVGADPFLSSPAVFFDIIQRRRNRHGASFCCGAGSIHRREAVFDCALRRKARDTGRRAGKYGLSGQHPALKGAPLEPYRFHVSEDIYTSIALHSDRRAGWRSVYHPEPQSRMLSPWSMQAWATQRLKYAGGTYDIMLRDNPVFQRGMPWRIKLHYAATFWSYLSVLWAPVLLLAPAISLLTAITPVKAYSTDFFLHFLPMILLAELAMLATCKGHAIGTGRMLAISTLPIQLRALGQVLRGRRPGFPPTPKTPTLDPGLRFALPNLILLGLMATAGLAGIFLTWSGAPGHSASLLMVNLFWLGWNMVLLGRICLAAFWRPARPRQLPPAPETNQEKAHAREDICQ